MPLTVACQMDPIDRIDIMGDSTFALLLEAQRRGHALFYYTPPNLSLLAGRLIARFGARVLMTIGMLCGLAGLVILTQISKTSGYELVLPGYLLFGIFAKLVHRDRDPPIPCHEG